jgi:hypothetical protein
VTLAERILALLAHRYLEDDPESNELLEGLVGGIADAAEQLGVIAYGDDAAGIPPGAALTDPAVAPAWALPHAALYTGGEMPARMPGEAEAAWLERARAAVVFPAGIRRGSHTAVRLAAAPHLTGTRTVFILDRVGNPYELVVRVRASEAADPDAVRLAIEGSYVSGGPRGAIRAELELVLIVSDGPIWQEAGAGVRWIDLAPGVTAQTVELADIT